MRTILSVLLVLTVAMPGQAQDKPKGDEMSITDKTSGITLMKPRDEKWKVYNTGKLGWFKDCKLCINHVIDSIGIEVAYDITDYQRPFKPVKDIGKDIVQNYEDMTLPKEGKPAQFKEIRWRKKDVSKFPTKGNPACFEVDAIVVRADDSKFELRHWAFVMKSDLLVQVVCIGAEGQFTEKKKDIDFIFGNIVFGKRDKK